MGFACLAFAELQGQTAAVAVVGQTVVVDQTAVAAADQTAVAVADQTVVVDQTVAVVDQTAVAVVGPTAVVDLAGRIVAGLSKAGAAVVAWHSVAAAAVEQRLEGTAGQRLGCGQRLEC